MVDLILASKSEVRKEILDRNNINVKVQPSTVDEEPIKNTPSRPIISDAESLGKYEEEEEQETKKKTQ